MKKKLFGILFLVFIAAFALWYFYDDIFKLEVLDGINPIISEEEDDVEKWNFINATKEASCLIYSSSNFEFFGTDLNEEAREIYLEHDIDAYDLDYMDELIEKYEEDEDLLNAISDAILNCVCMEGEVYDFDQGACVSE